MMREIRLLQTGETAHGPLVRSRKQYSVASHFAIGEQTIDEQLQTSTMQ